MTQEEKDLLLKDLCGRLPYNVKISVNNKIETLQGLSILDNVVEYDSFLACNIDEIKPYLLPLSSMTEEQCDELYNISELKLSFTPDKKINAYKETIKWFLKNHIDFNGLIPLGLAIDATDKNIY